MPFQCNLITKHREMLLLQCTSFGCMSFRGMPCHAMPMALWCNIIFVQFTVLQKIYLQRLRWLENFIPTFVDGTSISRLLDHKPLAIHFLSLGDPFPSFIVIIFHFRFFLSYLFPLKSRRRITHANTHTHEINVFSVSMRTHTEVYDDCVCDCATVSRVSY